MRGLWFDFSLSLTINTQASQRFATKVAKSCKVFLSSSDEGVRSLFSVVFEVLAELLLPVRFSESGLHIYVLSVVFLFSRWTTKI